MRVQTQWKISKGSLTLMGLSLFVMMAFIGCGSETTEPTGSVQGTVTIKGQPLKQGQVMLFSEPGRPVSIAPVTGEGLFQFTEPVPVGKYSVAILPFGEEVPAGAAPPGKPAAKALVIPPKYQNEVTSGLQASIAPGDNALTLQMK